MVNGHRRRADERLSAWRARTLARLERAFIQRMLRRHGGNVSQTARTLGIHRSTLQRLMRRHGLPAA